MKIQYLLVILLVYGCVAFPIKGKGQTAIKVYHPLVVNSFKVVDSTGARLKSSIHFETDGELLCPTLGLFEGDTVFLFEEINKTSKLIINVGRYKYVLDSFWIYYAEMENLEVILIHKNNDCVNLLYNVPVDYFVNKYVISKDCSHGFSSLTIINVFPIHFYTKKRHVKRYKLYYYYVKSKMKAIE